ncbi:hypothetical protein Q31b_16810 [Novipirellula aureliae]|uniref:Uncharacterized protein n=1 Tax=Novipirellula aureliae TaxID=2527966 RepID=A0A5C6E6A4_9BACT|nr:hypothetical protein [Novipirellula aureliae]TWU44145.1 hypothetical protein Q31b_16810 [Novipirellula aureliae]
MNLLKVAIWSLVIVGLTPAILLAVLNLTSTIALARHLKNNPGQQVDEGDVTLSQSYMEFGKRCRLEVTTSYWPSMTLLLGAGAFVVGLLYMIPPQTQHLEVQGFDKIEHYVERVANSRSPHAYLVVSLAEDEYTAVSVSDGDEGYTIEFYLTKKEQVVPVLAFLSKREIEPTVDTITEEGTEFETRHLSFPVDGTTEEVAELCRSVFLDAYGVEKDAELLFTLGE